MEVSLKLLYCIHIGLGGDVSIPFMPFQWLHVYLNLRYDACRDYLVGTRRVHIRTYSLIALVH